jgi:hypothetical protein
MKRLVLFVFCSACSAGPVTAASSQAKPRPIASPSGESPAGSERAEPVTASAMEPALAAKAAPAKPSLRPGAWANLDPDDDDVVGPPDVIDDCEGTLKTAGVRFAKATLAVHEETFKKTKLVCGAHQVVFYLGGPGKIAYSPPPLLTCAMAAALASFEQIAQAEALAAFKSPIARIDQLGTYNCRVMPAHPTFVSEHAYANAIDVGRFVLKDGRNIEIVRDFDVGDDEPKRPAGRFLRVLSRRANDEDVFSHVLTPFYDALHKNHFHLDLSRYRTDGTRPHG